MLDNATAHRVSGAEQKDWKEFFRNTQQTAKEILSPLSEEEKKRKNKRMDDKTLATFFGQLSQIKGTNQ